MSIIQEKPYGKRKNKDIPQKNQELEDDKPDYQEKITFLVSLRSCTNIYINLVFACIVIRI